MKKLVIALLLTICVQQSFAQQDERYYFPSKEWKSTENFDFEEYTFFADDDTLNAVLLQAASKPKATILYFHGSGGNVTNYMPLAKPLTEANYQVFMVDFRGYGKSTGKPTHVNIAKDAQMIFDQMQEMPAFKDQTLLVYGSSMGTQVATKIAKDNQDHVAALVLDGAIASFTDVALQYAPPAAHEGIKAQAKLFPYNAKEDIKAIEHMPKLIIHSKEDKEVLFALGQMVFKAAKAPKSFWVYEGGHLQAPAVNPEELVKRVDQLLEEEDVTSSNK